MGRKRNPFKQHHVPKKTVISRTAEREFEREMRKLETLDENTKKIYKATKGCTESQTAQSKSECKMTQNLASSTLCREDPALLPTVEPWKQATIAAEQLSQEMNATTQKTVTEPMKKFSTVFPSLIQAVKKRDQSLQEYTRCHLKVDKYIERERTGPTIVKLDQSKKALAAAKEDYDSLNHPLMEDMPALYDGRIDYFHPSFQALIKSQIKYYTESHRTYTELSKKLNPSDKSADEYNASIQQKISDIRALSITADDL